MAVKSYVWFQLAESDDGHRAYPMQAMRAVAKGCLALDVPAMTTSSRPQSFMTSSLCQKVYDVAG